MAVYLVIYHIGLKITLNSVGNLRQQTEASKYKVGSGKLISSRTGSPAVSEMASYLVAVGSTSLRTSWSSWPVK